MSAIPQAVSGPAATLFQGVDEALPPAAPATLGPVPHADSAGLFDRRGTFITFALLCLLMVSDFADRMILAALLPAIKADWQISDTTAGLLSSVLTLGMVLFAFPAALLIDRWSRVKSASLMGVVWSLASAAGAVAQNVGQLLLSRGLVGIGEAGYAPAGYTWIAAAFPQRRRQLALGVFSAAQPLGMALGVMVGGYVAAHYGWQRALGVVAMPGLLIALWLYRGRDFTHPPRSWQRVGKPEPKPYGKRQILRTPSLLLAYLSSALGTLQLVPLTYFLPIWLNREHGIALQTASLMTGSLVLITIISLPLGGWFMDRWNTRDERAKLLWPIAANGVATLFYAAALLGDVAIGSRYGLLLGGLFIGASAGTGPLALSQELVPAAIRAFSGTCAVVTIHLLGSVPGPLLTGLLSDRYGLTPALAVVTLGAGTAAVMTLLLALYFYPHDARRVLAASQ